MVLIGTPMLTLLKSGVTGVLTVRTSAVDHRCSDRDKGYAVRGRFVGCLHNGRVTGRDTNGTADHNVIVDLAERPRDRQQA